MNKAERNLLAYLQKCVDAQKEEQGMDRPQFTPGPWTYMEFERDGLTGYRITTRHGEAIAEIYPQPWPVHVNRFNAELIASAPGMLARILELERQLVEANAA